MLNQLLSMTAKDESQELMRKLQNAHSVADSIQIFVDEYKVPVMGSVGILIVFCIFTFIFNAYKYGHSDANPQKHEQAQKGMIWSAAIVGAAVSIFLIFSVVLTAVAL